MESEALPCVSRRFPIVVTDPPPTPLKLLLHSVIPLQLARAFISNLSSPTSITIPNLIHLLHTSTSTVILIAPRSCAAISSITFWCLDHCPLPHAFVATSLVRSLCYDSVPGRAKVPSPSPIPLLILRPHTQPQLASSSLVGLCVYSFERAIDAAWQYHVRTKYHSLSLFGSSGDAHLLSSKTALQIHLRIILPNIPFLTSLSTHFGNFDLAGLDSSRLWAQNSTDY